MHLIKRILTDPKTIILGVISGFVYGFFFKEQAHTLKPFADIYVSLLSMSLLPILVSALIWGIGQMLRTRKTRILFKRIAYIYVLGLFIPCVIGMAVALVFGPGSNLDPAAAAALGGRVSGVQETGNAGGFLAFIAGIVPSNVFEALSKSQFIDIVFFCALTGLALGVIRSPGADETLRILNALYETFSTIFHWVLIPLPIGLFLLVASHVSEADPALLTALLKYVGYFYLAGVSIFIVYICIFSVWAGVPPWRPLVALKTPLILAFATDNPFVALYSAIEGLQKHFDVDREVADTVVPFGVLANQHGQILLFAFTAIFLAQVYGIDLDVVTLITLGIGAIVAGAAAVGGGVVLAPIMAPILIGAGIPDVLAFVVLATTQAVVAPLVSVLTVQATCNLAFLAVTPLGGRKKTGTASKPATDSGPEDTPIAEVETS